MGEVRLGYIQEVCTVAVDLDDVLAGGANFREHLQNCKSLLHYELL